MLFSSYEFLFAFLPATAIVFHLVDRHIGPRAAVAWLVAASLFFFAWWDWRFLPLLVGSILFNYTAGCFIHYFAKTGRFDWSRTVLIISITANLAVLGWFKYSAFVAETFGTLSGVDLVVTHVVLPLGISFFTFEQIAYLVDVRRSEAVATSLLDYALFVAFFPRLVAGPILRYSEIVPQIQHRRKRVGSDDLAVGITIFCIGLFKKTFLADGVAVYVAPVFSAAAAGEQLDLLLAWGGALAYAMQLYFDFSGYSDMAIGAARVFGISLPLNFYSPYKSTSIIEFWRRWHITLSRFLRDYLYVPLGGNRKGRMCRYANLLLTMLLGGLWHGAGWTFVFWGVLHGAFLCINHYWRYLGTCSAILASLNTCFAMRIVYWFITFIAVLVAWVFFRAPTFSTALNLLQAMGGMNGIAVPAGIVASIEHLKAILDALGIGTSAGSGTALIKTWLWDLSLLAIALFLPNAVELTRRMNPAVGAAEFLSMPTRLLWIPSRSWAAAVAALGLVGILSIARGGEFLYWQF